LSDLEQPDSHRYALSHTKWQLSEPTVSNLLTHAASNRSVTQRV